MFDIGSSLREARVRQDLDFPELEERTKIRPKYLRALEDERFDILPAPGQPSGCMLDSDSAAAVPLIERLIANRGSFQICSAPRQSRPISDGLTPPTN